MVGLGPAFGEVVGGGLDTTTVCVCGLEALTSVVEDATGTVDE